MNKLLKWVTDLGFELLHCTTCLFMIHSVSTYILQNTENSIVLSLMNPDNMAQFVVHSFLHVPGKDGQLGSQVGYDFRLVALQLNLYKLHI